MTKGMKVCKVCGKEYPPCRAVTKGNEYRWQDVACCPAHGAQYLAEVQRERGILPASSKIEAGKADASAPVTDNEDKADASAPNAGREKKKKA